MIGDVYKYSIVVANMKAISNPQEPKNLLYEGEGYLTHITKDDKFILEDRGTGKLIKANYFFELERTYKPSEGYTGPLISNH